MAFKLPYKDKELLRKWGHYYLWAANLLTT